MHIKNCVFCHVFEFQSKCKWHVNAIHSDLVIDFLHDIDFIDMRLVSKLPSTCLHLFYFDG